MRSCFIVAIGAFFIAVVMYLVVLSAWFPPPYDLPTPAYDLPPVRTGAVYYTIPMTKHDFIFSHGVYALLALIIVTYGIFPSAYARVSQVIFTAVYRYHNPDIPRMPPPSSDMQVLYTVARPPQMPYDSMLMTLPDRGSDHEAPVGLYVYGADGTPVGYIQERRGSLYVVVLFSSPLSSERFSVGGYVTEGVGSGSGSFFLQIPSGNGAEVGTPIVHQVTGATVSHVAAVENIAEKNIMRVSGVISINPFETAVLYTEPGGNMRITPAALAATLADIRADSETGTARKDGVKPDGTDI